MAINSLNDAVQQLAEIQRYLTSIQSNVLQQSVSAQGVPAVTPSAAEFETLAAMLKSNQWPAAVPDDLICSETDAEKEERAKGILSMTALSLAGKKFLDFGCGEGHLVKVAAGTTKLAVGYDIVSAGGLTWEDGDPLLTTDFEKVKAQGPFDCVLLHDVLDHCENPVAALKQVASVCSASTEIHVRCHPFVARHGSHLYKQINKAWVGLIFTASELESLGYKPTEFVKPVLFPVNTYKQWFNEAGLRVVQEDMVRGDVEPFFSTHPIIRTRLINLFRPFTNSSDFPSWQISQHFDDFILRTA